MRRNPLIVGALEQYQRLRHAFGAGKNEHQIINLNYLEPRDAAEIAQLKDLNKEEEVLDELDRAKFPFLFFIKVKSEAEPYISSLYSYLSSKHMRAHYFFFEINQDVTPLLIQRAQSYYNKISPNPRIYNPSPRILQAYAAL